MNATKRHCDCCPTTVEHVRQHYDPDGLTQPDEDPADVLMIFQSCFDGEEACDLDIDDVKEYLETLREETDAD